VRNQLTIITAGLILALVVRADFAADLAQAAFERTKSKVTYDPAYVKIPYPNGDVDPSKGVCTDVVIRAYRKLGVDLQRLVHEDMKANFKLYPTRYGLKKPDRNIDHRRVPNLEVFFDRMGARVPATANAADYLPGDLVTWELSPGITHIGIVSDRKAHVLTARRQIIHNIGAGEVLEDVLFDWKILGHFRYRPAD
jgi:hypothetical protein